MGKDARKPGADRSVATTLCVTSGGCLSFLGSHCPDSQVTLGLSALKSLLTISKYGSRWHVLGTHHLLGSVPSTLHVTAHTARATATAFHWREPRVSEPRGWFRKVLATSTWPVGSGVRLELGGLTPALLQVLSVAEASVLGVNKALPVSAVFWSPGSWHGQPLSSGVHPALQCSAQCLVSGTQL